MKTYPPRPTRCDDVKKLLEVFGSVIVGRSAVYVSAPITSGMRLADWYTQSNGKLDRSHPSYDREHSKRVIKPNLIHARRIVEALRRKYESRVLIDPTAVNNLHGWTQDDYRYFWGSVIESYVASVIFIDGWQYSSGCTYEFLVAQKCNLETLDEKGQILALDTGLHLVSEALTEIDPTSESADFLNGVLGELSNLTSKKEKDSYAELKRRRG